MCGAPRRRGGVVREVGRRWHPLWGTNVAAGTKDWFAAIAVSERCVVSFRSPRHCRHPFHAPTDGISDRSEIDYAYRRMLNAILPNRLQSAAFQNVNTWRGFTIADVNPRSNVELAQELSPTVQWTTFWSRATRRPSRGLAGSPTHRPSVPQRLLVR